MFLPNVFRGVRRRSKSSRWHAPTHRQRALAGQSYRLMLEQLEERALPTTLTVTSPADDGDGSLRTTIAIAQNGDQIVFDDSLQGQTITLTSGELAVTKSLDIEGLGADKLTVSVNHA